MFLVVSFPATEVARQQAEADLAANIASENKEYCAKWGMPIGSPEHADCIRDLWQSGLGPSSASAIRPPPIFRVV